MLVKVALAEIDPEARLSFDLYAATGERLYLTGHRLALNELEELHTLSLYRNTAHLPVEIHAEESTPNYEAWLPHEGHLIHFPDAALTPTEREELNVEEAIQPIYGPELSQSFLSSIHFFWEKMARGATPDIALCEVISEQLIAQVADKADHIHYLSQIRVRDQFTYSHILDVTSLSIALAIKAGFSRKEVKEIALAGILHDLGKLLIPKAIMFKPTRLTEKEFQVMKLHPELGYRILKDEMKLPDQICRPALEHQEMYAGGGYPQNISGSDIHPYSHVVKIADVYDALTSKRPYKESIPSSKAIKIMLSEGDKSFHPEFLAHFVKLANYTDHTKDMAHERAS